MLALIDNSVYRLSTISQKNNHQMVYILVTINIKKRYNAFFNEKKLKKRNN